MNLMQTCHAMLLFFVKRSSSNLKNLVVILKVILWCFYVKFWPLDDDLSLSLSTVRSFSLQQILQELQNNF